MTKCANKIAGFACVIDQNVSKIPTISVSEQKCTVTGATKTDGNSGRTIEKKQCLLEFRLLLKFIAEGRVYMPY